MVGLNFVIQFVDKEAFFLHNPIYKKSPFKKLKMSWLHTLKYVYEEYTYIDLNIQGIVETDTTSL